MQFKNLISLFIFLIAVTTFVSCDKKEEQSISVDNLVAHWELMTIEGWVQVEKGSQIPYEKNFQGQDNYIVFYEDNTGYLNDWSEEEEKEEAEQKTEFQWKVNKRTLSLMYSLTEIEEMNIIEVTSSRLILDIKQKEDDTTIYMKMAFKNMYK